jgi:hypothetical protein
MFAHEARQRDSLLAEAYRNKMKPLLSLVVSVLALCLLPGCSTYSPHDASAESFENQVRAGYKQAGLQVPVAHQTVDERRNSYPADTTSAEWKSISPPPQK